ncbi:MAG TPA: dihydropteroate synthase [Candidatus Limnocylindrales bacterium]|nr:dihydropteroate synthase [Candidatus Limnocylindrales bacterium]
MDATPSVALPTDAQTGIPDRPPRPTTIRGRELVWGSRTFVMGIINVTPDSFSGDGLMATGADPVAAAVAQARQMAAEGADLLDIGGESTRPGHEEVLESDELRRVEPVVRAVREALPDMPLSIDSTRAAAVEAALDAGADVINDVWGVRPSDGLARLAAERGAPLVLMHNREEARYRNVVSEVIADLQGAIDRALGAGVPWEQLIVDPGIGFGKTAEHNLALLHDLHALTVIGRPILLGTSRKSTIGKVLDLPAGERLEGTLATTALGVQSGVDIVRVHDVKPNVRVARMADAIVRGGREHVTQTGEPR